jgi:hypothetical protein
MKHMHLDLQRLYQQGVRLPQPELLDLDHGQSHLEGAGAGRPVVVAGHLLGEVVHNPAKIDMTSEFQTVKLGVCNNFANCRKVIN